MKSFFLITGLLMIQLTGLSTFAATAPSGFPIVNGVVRKIDLSGSRVSLKHDAIPNLSMPGMTMSFAVQTASELTSLAVGDDVNFAADEIDGELTVLWIEKAPAVAVAAAQIFCTGVANTTPRTNIEVEVRKDKFSTIRYEFAEGPYKGTAHINSIGRMELQVLGDSYVYKAGSGIHDSRLVLEMEDGLIKSSRFTNFSAGMSDALVQCEPET